MLEKRVEQMLTRGVEALGGKSFKWVSPGHDGVPDRIIVMPGGYVYFVEMKAETGELSALQRFQLRQLKSLGCHALVLHGADETQLFLTYLRMAQKGDDIT